MGGITRTGGGITRTVGEINRSPCVIIGVTEAGRSPWENPVGNFSHNRKKLQIHQGLDKKRACSAIASHFQKGGGGLLLRG